MKNQLFFNNKEIEYPKGKFDLYYGLFTEYYDNPSQCNLDSPEKEKKFLDELSKVISDKDFDMHNKLSFMSVLMEMVHFGTFFYLPDSK